ncbi:XRE family transcriptional regulator, partial [Vibrio cholerae]|nr:XRE family transcriptional regulator [Vibrio cholerae]
FPTLKRKTRSGEKLVHLQNRVTVDGDIKRVYVEGNQVIIEYTHLAK